MENESLLQHLPAAEHMGIRARAYVDRLHYRRLVYSNFPRRILISTVSNSR